MAFEFKFPDIGEGIVEGELLAWKVKEGDTVAENQTLAEVETDKAVIELPSPRAGRVVKLYGAEGDMIKVGAVVVAIEEAGTASRAMATEASAVAPAAPEAAPITPEPSPAAPEATLTAATPAREEVPYTGSVVGQLEEAPAEEATVAAAPVAPAEAGVAVTGGAAERAVSQSEGAALAMPSVRALAEELGVDLTGIRGTGPGGRVLKQDVEDAAEVTAYGGAVLGTEAAPVTSPSQVPAPPVAPIAAPVIAHAVDVPVVPRLAPAAPVGVVPPGPAGEPRSLMGGVLENDGMGVVERIALRGVRRTMAKRMAEALAKQAQVTSMDEADVTVLRHIREKERAAATERGVRLTYLAFVIKACTAALKRFPRLNAVLEESREEFLVKHYYNIGFAVDTKTGLVVPNIKAADTKSIFRIAEEIVTLVDKATDRRLELEDLHGGTFTISNYGAIGSTFATPVVNYPEVAILGMGRVRELPVVREGKIAGRHMLPLSLTFDHQLVDGAEAARFLNLVISYLEDPDLLLLEGD